MKKFNFLILLLIMMVIITGCNKGVDTVEEEKSNVPDYFLEPDNHTICSIKISKPFSSGYYGYINNDDLELYNNGDIKTLKVLHPYEEGKFAIVNVEEIAGVLTGEYKDYR